MLPRRLLLDGPDGPSEEPPEGTRLAQTSIGQGRQAQRLALRPAVIEQRTNGTPRVSAHPASPVEPTKASRVAIEKKGQAAQPRPVAAAPHEPLLHTMRENIGHPLEERGLVQDGLGGVSALPEAAAPSDEPSNLLGHVREEVLHEARQIPPWSPKHQVQVIRDHTEGEELHAVKTHGTREYAAKDLDRLFGRTEQKTPLEASRGHKDDVAGVEHPDGPG